MKLKFLFFALLICGFSFGQVNIIPPRTDVSGFLTWTDTEVVGTTYIQLLKANSATITPAMDFDAFTAETLNFTARTFGGTNVSENTVTISISTDNGGAWTILGSRLPITNMMVAQTPFDLSSYSGTQVKVKFSVGGTSDAIGVGIDDIKITGIAASVTPTINVTPTTLTGFSYILGNGPSAEQIFNVSATSLTADLVVSALPEYEVSKTTSTGFGTSVTFIPSSGTVASAQVFTRLKAGLAIGTYNQQITAASTGATPNTVDVQGSMTALTAPVISSALIKSTIYGTADTYTITASNSPTTYSTGTLPTGFTLSGAVLSKSTTVDAGTYTISISATNGGGTDTKTLVWTVTPKAVTVTGLSGDSKIYNGTTAASFSGGATLNGILFSDAVTLSGTPSATFSDKNAGARKIISFSGYTLSGAKAANYNVIQPTVTADITQKSLTVTGAVAQNKVYDGTTTAIISGATLSGVIGGDAVTVSGGGNFSSSNAGTAISVVASLVLGGADGSNYVLSQPTGLSANITKANPTFDTTTAISVSVGRTYSLPGSINPSSDGAISYIISSGGAATIVGTTITGISVGTETLTVNQAASGNFNGGSATIALNIILVSYSNGDFLSISGTGNYEDASSWSKCGSIGGCTGTTIGAGGWALVGGSKPSAASTVFINGAIKLNTALGVTNSTILSGGNLIVSGAHPVSNSLTIKSGGLLTIDDNLNFNNVAATFVVEDNADVHINYYATNPNTSLWKGIESFAATSNFYFNYGRTAAEIFTSEPTITTNPATGAKFGNLIFQPTTFVGTGNWTGIFPIGTYNLTKGDFIVNNSSDKNLTFNGGDISVGSDFIVNVTSVGEVATRSIAGIGSLTVKGDFTKNGTGMFRLNGGGNYTLNIDGDILINQGVFRTGVSFSGSTFTTVNLKGDLKVLSSGVLDSNNNVAGNVNFNFIGPGNGLTPATTQTIDIATTIANENKYIVFNVKSGAYVQLIARDFELGTNSKVNVDNGGVLDFGFNGSTPLNLVRVGAEIGQSFSAQANSTLKITSPLGITSFGTYDGNVQIGASAPNRSFDVDAKYHYIGQVDQVSGNGLPDAVGGKTVIVELLNNSLRFWATPVTSVKRFNSSGEFKIISGTVLDGQNPDNVLENYGRFSDAIDAGAAPAQSGKLTMSGGRYIVYHSTTAAPNLSGVYDLTGGVIQFDGNNQSVRSPKEYINMEITGVNVGTPSGNITLKNNGTFIVKPNALFLINNNAIIGPVGTQTVTVEGGGVFSTGDSDGFNGGTGMTTTSVRNDIETIILMPNSTVEYSRNDVLQNITDFAPYYATVKISGTGEKVLATPNQVFVNENLIVAASKLVLSANQVIKVREAVLITDALAEVQLKDNSQLIQITEVDANSGTNFKLQRSATVNNYDYVYWSAPVAGFDVSGLLNNNRYLWNPRQPNANGTVGNYVTATGIMARGIGYIARSAAVQTLTTNFAGKPHNGLFSTTIYRGNYDGPNVVSNPSNPLTLPTTKYDDNWNLIGNPYPSAISAQAFLNKNSSKIDGSIWVWKHGLQPNSNVDPYYGDFVLNYHSTDFIKFNALGPTPPGFDGFIATGQGFFVSMLHSAGTFSNTIPGALITNDFYSDVVVFDNTLRSSGVTYDSYNNNQFYKPSTNVLAVADVAKSRIWLDIANSANNEGDTMLLGYTAEATYGRDQLYDCFYTLRNETSLYSLIDSEPFIIQGRPSPFDVNDRIPLGVKIVTAGNHVIAINTVDGIFVGNHTIYLEDKLRSLTHNLSEAPYNFDCAAGTFDDRFVLKFTNESLSTNDVTIIGDLAIAVSKDQVSLKSSQVMTSLKLYDVAGKLVYSSRINGTDFTTASLSAKGVLIAKIKFANGETAERKLML